MYVLLSLWSHDLLPLLTELNLEATKMIKLYRSVAFLSVTPLLSIFSDKTVIIRIVSSFPHIPRPP